MDTSTPALQARDVGFSYGEDFVLSHVNFQIQKGETLCILGPNGSGKTTLFNAISGGTAPIRGYVYFNGEDLYKNHFRLSDSFVTMPFHPPALSLSTPMLYWQGFGQSYGMTRREVINRLMKLVPQMDMQAHLHRYFSLLSLGMQQKMALIAAFLPPATMRMLDEPFSGGIDPLAMESLAAWLANSRAAGETIVFSSQMTEHAQRLADKVIIMRKGRAAAFGTIEQIIESSGIPRNADRAFAQAYIAITEENAGTP